MKWEEQLASVALLLAILAANGMLDCGTTVQRTTCARRIKIPCASCAASQANLKAHHMLMIAMTLVGRCCGLPAAPCLQLGRRLCTLQPRGHS